MNKTHYSFSFFIKAIIALFWTALIFFFLFSSVIIQHWHPSKSINILVWADLFDEQTITQFEKETGIKVYVSYFESNEELFVKMKGTKGGLYDLIMPSDYMVQLLQQEGLLQPLDKQKISIINRIDDRLLSHYYDPENNVCLPYYWGIYGLGIDTTFFKEMPASSWGLLFNHDQDHCLYEVAMPNVAREAIMIAAQYLFGNVAMLSKEQLSQIIQLLQQQKRCVAAYTDFRADYLLTSKTCPVIVTMTPLIARTMHIDSSIDFILPQEGSFIIIDTIAIPVRSKKQEYVYQFINYIYNPEIIRHQFLHHTFFPATIDLPLLFAENNMNKSIQNAHLGPVSRLQFFSTVIPEEELTTMWIALKGN